MKEANDDARRRAQRKPWVIAWAVVLGSCVVVALFTVLLDSGSNPGSTNTLRGEAIVASPGKYGFDPATCSPNGHAIVINAVSEGAEKVELKRGTKQSDGSCSFTFVTEVPKADRYVFTMPGTGAKEYSFNRTLIDTNGPTGVELVVTLRW